MRDAERPIFADNLVVEKAKTLIPICFLLQPDNAIRDPKFICDLSEFFELLGRGR